MSPGNEKAGDESADRFCRRADRRWRRGSPGTGARNRNAGSRVGGGSACCGQEASHGHSGGSGRERPDDFPRGSLRLSSEKGEHRGFCLYERQGVRIVCEDRKDDQSDMKWVKGFIVFLVVGFALFYLIAYPEAAANAVRAVAGGLAVVFRSILIFFQSLAS
jgi:hypothetical protein